MSEATITVEGSVKGFSSESSGFVPLASIGRLNGTRYLRMNISLVNTSTSAPFELTRASWDYDLGTANQFDYSGGCGIIGRPNGGGPPWMIFILLLAPLLILARIRRRSPLVS